MTPPFVGSLGGKSPTPIVGIAATPTTTRVATGWWRRTARCSPSATPSRSGISPAWGSETSGTLTAIVPTPDGGGYPSSAPTREISAFGDATEIGSLPALGVKVNNIVGAVPTA